MQCMILVGGRGSRLGRLTEDTPKPMLPVGGKPLLQHTVELLRQSGITEIVMNPCYLGHKITDYFGSGEKFGVKINYSMEIKPLGTAGAVRQAVDWGFLSGPLSFMVLYGDNYYGNMNLHKFSQHHYSQEAPATLGVCRVSMPHIPSKVYFNPNGHVSGFVEKPNIPDLHSFAGMIMMFPRLTGNIPEGVDSDFGQHIIQDWVNRSEGVIGYEVPYHEKPIDIGTREGYSHACKAHAIRSGYG